MAYRALCFDAPGTAAPAWADALIDAGALSVDLADPGAATDAESPIYSEPGEMPAEAWPVSRVTALFSAQTDPEAVLRAVAADRGEPPPACEVRLVPEQDWVRATQAQFGPIRISERLWIVPSWREPPEPAAINLALDPGLAFGTGSHPTTRLCLHWLEGELLAQSTVLDYGCGSGILAIAAARLGAAMVTGTDIDPQALLAARDNARRNGVTATFVGPDALPAATYDVLVANILANPLVLLAPALAQRVRHGGSIVLSGILEAQAEDVMEAYRPWFRIARWRSDEGWVALAGTRT